MSFYVDIVTEDSFYENLTLGVVKVLENIPYIKNVRIDRRNGCESTAITNWEQRHCCTLPEDLKNFYASIDGFLLQWSLEISGEEFPVGRMEVGTLSSLKRYSGNVKERQADSVREASSFSSSVEFERAEEATSSSVTDLENVFPALLQGSDGHNCKIFEIAQCFPESGKAKVCLVYRMKLEQEAPTIWLHREEANRWHHLADNFTVYFRMMLVHLGLPLWQCCVTGTPLPTWVEQVYYLVGPHLLPSTVEPTETISASMWNMGPTNVIDPAIFKTKLGKQKCSRKK